MQCIISLPDGAIHADIEQQFKDDGITLKIVNGNTVIFDSYSPSLKVQERNITGNNISKLNSGKKFKAKFSVNVDAAHVSAILNPQTVKDYLVKDKKKGEVIIATDKNPKSKRKEPHLDDASLYSPRPEDSMLEDSNTFSVDFSVVPVIHPPGNNFQTPPNFPPMVGLLPAIPVALCTQHPKRAVANEGERSHGPLQEPAPKYSRIEPPVNDFAPTLPDSDEDETFIKGPMFIVRPVPAFIRISKPSTDPPAQETLDAPQGRGGIPENLRFLVAAANQTRPPDPPSHPRYISSHPTFPYASADVCGQRLSTGGSDGLSAIGDTALASRYSPSASDEIMVVSASDVSRSSHANDMERDAAMVLSSHFLPDTASTPAPDNRRLAVV